MNTEAQRRSGGLVRIAVALLLFKIFIALITLGAGTLLPGLWSDDSYYGNYHWPPTAPPTNATRFATWDAQHYLFLATQGYGPGRPSIAFFPLFPWLIRGVASTGIPPLAAALFLANALSLAGCLLLHRFLERRHPECADDTLLLLLAFPGAFFLHFPYTEGLFLLLAVVAVAAAAADRPLQAGGAGFLLALTRPNGVLIAAVFAQRALVRWRQDKRLSPSHLVAVAAPFLGLGAYLLFMRASTGDALAGFDMQKAFHAGRSLGSFLHPLSLVRAFADVRVFHGIDHSLLDRLVFLVAAATLLPLWRLDRTLFWYALPMALVGPLSGSFVSYTRFAAILFPCHLVLARTLGGERRRPFLWLTLAVSFGFQIVLLMRHINFRWVG